MYELYHLSSQIGTKDRFQRVPEPMYLVIIYHQLPSDISHSVKVECEPLVVGAELIACWNLISANPAWSASSEVSYRLWI